MFIKGKRIIKEKRLSVINPYNNQVIEEVGLSEEKDVVEAVQIAQEGYRILKNMPAGERARILEKTAKIIKERKEEFARIISLEVGKTINEARTEVERAINTINLSAMAALGLKGETVRFDLTGPTKKMGFYIRVPLGIVLAISPFNFPLNLSCHKIGPAIAAGNAVIHKPASKTPLSALMLAEALLEAGLPEQGISVLVGPGSTIGMKLVRTPEIRKISFTGSLEVGEVIMANCGMKRVTMELGSNSAVIVFKDAPIKIVAKKIRKGGYTLAGQVCISVQRVYVEEEIADEFLRELSIEVGQIKYGDPLLEDTEMGPMIDEAAIKKAMDFVEDARKNKGLLILGGSRQGTIFLPTIIFDVDESAKIIQEEAFAPMVAVNKFKTIDEVIEKVNNTKYGLQTGIFTRNIDLALKCARAIDSGGVLINEIPTFRVDNMPYGGMKGSGLGREGPEFAIKEMTEEKLIIFDQIEQ
jgi:acyl-CoA reductase-like NAD-dependent aldehyde dehydrogenase|uniref:Aldehyde dehydrogenase family protein n=1 Tax=candidate division WOR-3 bacterium TaxID=2052148 RepID=A0A7V3RID6_UNCW3